MTKSMLQAGAVVSEGIGVLAAILRLAPEVGMIRSAWLDHLSKLGSQSMQIDLQAIVERGRILRGAAE